MPVLAVSFLAMGLACTGFPGTIGFAGQELLVRGAVDVFPVMGLALVAASALTGLAGSVADAAKFFHENCYYEEKPSLAEAMRGTFDPGFLNYTLGKWEILKLREDYKRAQGSGYRLQNFHDKFLHQGFPPIKIVRKSLLGNNTPVL